MKLWRKNVTRCVINTSIYVFLYGLFVIYPQCFSFLLLVFRWVTLQEISDCGYIFYTLKLALYTEYSAQRRRIKKIGCTKKDSSSPECTFTVQYLYEAQCYLLKWIGWRGTVNQETCSAQNIWEKWPSKSSSQPQRSNCHYHTLVSWHANNI